jgi:hypothetical protein
VTSEEEEKENKKKKKKTNLNDDVAPCTTPFIMTANFGDMLILRKKHRGSFRV